MKIMLVIVLMILSNFLGYKMGVGFGYEQASLMFIEKLNESILAIRENLTEKGDKDGEED